MSTITLETEHGRRVHIINSGGLIGDTACPKDFVHTFAKCIREWQLRPGSTEPMRMALITKSPVTGHTTDLSISTFADDIAKKHVGKDTQQTVDMAHMASLALDVSLGKKGYVQNVDKLEMTLLAVGPGANTDMKKFYNGGMGRASTTTACWAQLEGRRKKTCR